MHMLEDRKPHQPRRQRRMSTCRYRPRRTALEEAQSIADQLGERVISVDDLVEPRLKKSFCRCPPLLGRIKSPPQADGATKSRSNGAINLQEIKPTAPLSCKCNNSPILENASKIRLLPILHGRRRHRAAVTSLHSLSLPLAVRDRAGQKRARCSQPPKARPVNGDFAADV